MIGELREGRAMTTVPINLVAASALIVENRGG